MAEEVAQFRVRSSIDTPCPKHPDTEAMVICCNSECDEALACVKCIVEGGCHNGHKLTLLQDHLKSFKDKVEDFNRNTREQILNPLKTKADKIASDFTTYDGTTSALVKEIETRGKLLHSQVDELVNEYKTKCSSIKASNRQILEKYQSALLARITEIEEDIALLDEKIKGSCKADIIQAAKTGISKTYPSMDYPEEVKDVSFQLIGVPLEGLKRFLGRILIGNEHPISDETEEEKLKQLENKVEDLGKRTTADAHQMKKMQETIDDLSVQLEKSRSALQAQQQPPDECQSCHEPNSSCRCMTCPSCTYKGLGFTWVLWLCPKCGYAFKK